MSLKKFASFEVISKVLVPANATTAQLARVAHRVEFNYQPRPGFLYVRSRAISSRCNDNYDEFPAEEIKKAYATFVGKPVFVNHHNDNHRRARGVIIDAALHEDKNPDGTPDTWAEVLMEVDAVRFPKLAQAILAGHIDRTSMGTDVAYSICSACNNKASSPSEYCEHIPRMKGKRLYRTTASGKKEGVLIREKCYGLGFFENSLLVEEPADPTAYFLGVDDRGMKMSASKQASLPKTQKCSYCTQQATKRVLHAEGMAYVPVCDGHQGKAVAEVGGQNEVSGVRPIAARQASLVAVAREAAEEDTVVSPADLDGRGHLHSQAADIPLSPEDREFYRQMHEQGQRDQEMDQHARQRAVDLSDPHDLKAHLFEAHGWDESDLWRNSHPEDHPAMMAATDEDRPLTHTELRGAHDHEHNVEFPEDYPNAVTMGDSHFHTASRKQAHGDHEHPDVGYYYEDSPGTGSGVHVHRDGTTSIPGLGCPHCGGGFFTEDARTGHIRESHPGQYSGPTQEMQQVRDLFRESLLAEAKGKPVSEMSPEEKAEHDKKVLADRATGQKWNRQHPVKIKNVVDHWNLATPEEKSAGKNWYSDAHHLAKHIANDTGTDMHTMAGLLAVYSPQTHWAQNIQTAARVARTKQPLGGKGEGVLATSHQKNSAQRLLDGDSFENVVKGPKIRAFAHLIEHGGNADPSDPKVVVDRHALSVAAGSRCPDSGYMESGLGGKGRYQQVSDVYHKASKRISKAEGKTVESHHVQATTWLVRQRLNEEHDRALSKTAGARSAEAAKTAISTWNSYAAEHHPGALGKEPGTGYSQDTPDDVKHASDMKEDGMPVSKASSRQFERLAFGETKAPSDVDTLRDEECPVCGERDSYDGNSCQVCGFDAPPAMFRDPDLDVAKGLDLRKDIAEDAGQLPGQEENGGLPAEVPGQGQPGNDAVPLQEAISPDQLGPNGEFVGLDPNADPTQDPNAADQHFDQGGEPFTPGPNAPQDPEAPEGPGNPDTVDPEALDQDGQMPPTPPNPDQGDPGTPDDGVADLVCPSCGFQSDAAQPTSVDMDTQAISPAGGDGTMAGDVCPNCGQAQLLSVGEMEQMASGQGAPMQA